MTFAAEWAGCLHGDISARMTTHPNEFPRLDDRHIGAAVILYMDRRGLTCTDDEFAGVVQIIKPLLVADRAWQRRNPNRFNCIHSRRR